MINEPIEVHAIINGERVVTTNRYSRENPTNPSEIVAYGPVNTRVDAIQASLVLDGSMERRGSLLM